MTSNATASAGGASSASWVGFEGIPLAGNSWGDSKHSSIALLHGGGQTRHAWKNTGARLANIGYRVLAFDARGHGDSGWDPNGDYTHDSRVADLQAVLKAERASRPILIGASMGGITSLIAAGENLVDVRALVLVDITPRVELDGVERIRSFMDNNPEGFDSLEDVADAIARYQPHRPRPQTLDGLSKNVRLRGDGKYHWHWDPRIREQKVSPMQRQERLESCARNLKAPTLLVRGGMSDLVSEENAKSFLALCPSAEYVSVNAASHMVVGDRNDVFAEAAMEFLLRVTPPIRDDQFP